MTDPKKPTRRQSSAKPKRSKLGSGKARQDAKLASQEDKDQATLVLEPVAIALQARGTAAGRSTSRLSGTLTGIKVATRTGPQVDHEPAAVSGSINVTLPRPTAHWVVHTSPPPAFRSDWQFHLDEILEKARSVVDLYSELDAIFAPLKRRLDGVRSNTANDFPEVLAEIDQQKTTIAAVTEVLGEQLASDAPKATTIQAVSHVFKTVAMGLKRLALKVGQWVIEADVKAEAPALMHRLADNLGHLYQMLIGLFC